VQSSGEVSIYTLFVIYVSLTFRNVSSPGVTICRTFSLQDTAAVCFTRSRFDARQQFCLNTLMAKGGVKAELHIFCMELSGEFHVPAALLPVACC
jgi:hypothetical protein